MRPNQTLRFEAKRKRGLEADLLAAAWSFGSKFGIDDDADENSDVAKIVEPWRDLEGAQRSRAEPQRRARRRPEKWREAPGEHNRSVEHCRHWSLDYCKR